jgi:hypothetical protein
VSDGENGQPTSLNAIDHAIVLEDDFSDVRSFHLGNDPPGLRKPLKPFHSAENVDHENSGRFNVVLGNIVGYFIDSLER